MSLNTFLSIVLLLGATGYLLLGARLVAARREIGSLPIGLLFLIMSIWVAGGAIELLAPSLEVFLVGRMGHFVATALVPVVAFVCFREYTGSDTPMRLVVAMLLIPAASIVLAATNSLHEFMWYLPNVSANGQYLARPGQWGPWFLFVHAPYSYAVMGAAIFSLLVHSSAVAPAHRRGLFLLTAACMAPISATLLYDFGVGPRTLSYVPIALAAMLPIYAWLIVVERIVEFSPLAYETVFQNMQDPVVVIDDQQRILGLNQGAEDMLSMDETQALRSPLETVFGLGSTTVFEVLETGEPKRMLTDSGRFLHVQVSSIDTSGTSARGGRVLMFRDVSDVERAQSEVRKSEKLLRTLIDHSVNGIIRMRWVEDETTGKQLRCIFANAAAGRLLGIDMEELIDRAASDIVDLATTGMDRRDAEDVLERFEAKAGRGEGLDIEVCQRSGATGRWLRMICEPVGDDIAATFIDVTDGKTREKQMESIAWSDPLTGVLNRRGFERHASRRLAESNDDATGALLFIDLNDFKQINDHCGHEVGDQLLTIAAQRLKKSLRSCDIIGRPGGDEFVALVPDVTADIADRLAKRLTNALEEPYMIGEEQLRCSASIGLALYPDNANTLTGLLREADQAMYRAKQRSRDEPDVGADDLLEKAI
ncbi:MAG: diguanylate cyclase [Woeseiaceae bacterium]|nr:diguanylate cyclase [Woeseiaceae bacterium]